MTGYKDVFLGITIGLVTFATFVIVTMMLYPEAWAVLFLQMFYLLAN